jgi:hypothetical protein
MATIFRDARLKIDRADKHISDLKEAILRLEDTYTSTIKIDRDSGHQGVIYTFPKFQDALIQLSPIVGDAIHNIHAALDFAYSAAVKSLIPSEVSKFTKFPVYPTREKLERVLKGRDIHVSCPILFKTIIDEIQPYEGGQAGVINVLHDLDISDKHIVLLELLPTSWVHGIIMRDEKGEASARSMLVKGNGVYVLTFPKGFAIENKGKLYVTITVKDAGIFNGLPVSDMLSGFSQYILYVVQLLENL